MGRGFRQPAASTPAWLRSKPDWAPKTQDELDQLVERAFAQRPPLVFTCVRTSSMYVGVELVSQRTGDPETAAVVELHLMAVKTNGESQWAAVRITDGPGRKRRATVLLAADTLDQALAEYARQLTSDMPALAAPDRMAVQRALQQPAA